MNAIPNALTIAGSDSGGGAGIQADLKSFSANRVYGASVITALTAQNTVGVTAIHDVPVGFIDAQMDAVFTDLNIAAVKIGMLSQVPVIKTIVNSLKKHRARNIVFDPVMVTSTGDPLLHGDAVKAVRSVLMPLADLVTPNLHEAAKLTGLEIANSESDMIVQANELLKHGAQAVLIKGGHRSSSECADLLKSATDEIWFRADRIKTSNTHGTGCSLSSAIAAHLAYGRELREAVQLAKNWLTSAIAASGQLSVGSGNGPVHHFHELWSN